MKLDEALEILDEVTSPAAIAFDLLDTVAFAKKQPDQKVKKTVVDLLARFNAKEKIAIGSFIAQLTDELDPNIPEPD